MIKKEKESALVMLSTELLVDEGMKLTFCVSVSQSHHVSFYLFLLDIDDSWSFVLKLCYSVG